MSLRKEQRRRMQAVGELIKDCLMQPPQQVQAQQMIDQGIVEELLQTNAISTVPSLSTLRLIIYELVLHISHMPPPPTTPVPVSTNRTNSRQPIRGGSVASLQSPDDALIDQLQSLVFKKEAIIGNMQRQQEQIRAELREIQGQLYALREEHKQLFSEKLFLEEERDQLRTELLEIMRFQPETSMEHEETQEVPVWIKQPPKEGIDERESDGKQEADGDVLRCLLSQALTIEALLQ